MTTTITVQAGTKEAVRVTQFRISTGKPSGFWIVNEDEERQFAVDDGIALVVSEFQPGEGEPMDSRLVLSRQ